MENGGSSHVRNPLRTRLSRLMCRLSIHGPRPAVVEGDNPWPIRFQRARCGVWALDYGPEH